jgi:hypothetical protein
LRTAAAIDFSGDLEIFGIAFLTASLFGQLLGPWTPPLSFFPAKCTSFVRSPHV